MWPFMTFCSLGKSALVELGGQKNAVDITADFFQKDEQKQAVMSPQVTALVQLYASA